MGTPLCRCFSVQVSIVAAIAHYHPGCDNNFYLKVTDPGIRFLGGKDKELETVKAFIGANTDNFINALDLIDSEYGSMSNYLQGPLGLSEEDIRLLKEHYLQAVE